jgi:subtilisin
MAYSYEDGFGFVNAAAAVAAAIGEDPFPNVKNETYPDGSVNGEDWGINMVNAPEAWLQGYTGEDVTVAVLDTGVDLNHPDLADNIWINEGEIADNGIDDDENGYTDDVNGWNFFYDQNNTWDRNGHGTHVAGTIAAVDNNEGTTGVAPNATIMPIQVLPDTKGEKGKNVDAVAQGIRYAVDNGARVLNLSLEDPKDIDRTYLDALKYASKKDVIVVMAAGNGDKDGNPYPSPLYPAAYANKWGVAVGAVDWQNRLANDPGIWASNLAGNDSSLAYVTAPGVEIYSTAPDEGLNYSLARFLYDGYKHNSGTSMAAPHVAGIVALMLSANPDLTDADVRDILTSTASNSLASSASSLSASSSLEGAIAPSNNTLKNQSLLNRNSSFGEESSAFNVGTAPGDDLLSVDERQNTKAASDYFNVAESFANNSSFNEEDLTFSMYGTGADPYTPSGFQDLLAPPTSLYDSETGRDGILTNQPYFV